MGKRISINEVYLKLQKCNLELIGDYINVTTRTMFRCYCGNIFVTIPRDIFRGHTTSCGCYNKKINSERCLIDLTKREFDTFRVLRLLPKTKEYRQYECLCQCGRKFIAIGDNLSRNHTRSCGCLKQERFTGENNPNYNSLLTLDDRLNGRNVPELIEWRKQVYNRDNYTCRICNKYGGKIVAHHLDGYHWCKERRFDITNGVTLCNKCHKKFHTKYGRKNNTEQQFLEYVK